ncbi:hypothetical protein [Helcococcus bovis]|uniref:Uncharacterized protein n=1 Tax=Helcococcus bovis TaxID=3153252 RepID=A0ABW9F4U1_9FIRM
MREREEMATSLYAISIVSKKLARQLLQQERRKIYGKDKTVKRNSRKPDRNCRRLRKPTI